MAPSPPEIHVLGAGPTGALTALALGLRGHHVVLFDPLTASELQSRSRAYAITHSSRRLLTNLGLWDDLRDALVPFRDLDLRGRGPPTTRVLFKRGRSGISQSTPTALAGSSITVR